MRPQRFSLHCFIPPYLLDVLSRSADPRVRKLAVDAIEASATARAVRATLSTMPQMAAIPSPKGTKHRLIYDLEGRNFAALPGKLVRSEGQGRTKDPAVNEAYERSMSSAMNSATVSSPTPAISPTRMNRKIGGRSWLRAVDDLTLPKALKPLVAFLARRCKPIPPP